MEEARGSEDLERNNLGTRIEDLRMEFEHYVALGKHTERTEKG
jgi:hypothetical protein